MSNNYPIPGCRAYISLPTASNPTVCVDGDLTLADLRWLVAEMERIEALVVGEEQAP